MSWENWNVFIRLGKYGTTLQPPRLLCQVKARTKTEAETKGLRVSRQRGLSGLIGVQKQMGGEVAL